MKNLIFAVCVLLFTSFMILPADKWDASSTNSKSFISNEFSILNDSTEEEIPPDTSELDTPPSVSQLKDVSNLFNERGY